LVNAVAWPTSCSALDEKGVVDVRGLIVKTNLHKLYEVTILGGDVPSLQFFFGENRQPMVVKLNPFLVQCEVLKFISSVNDDVEDMVCTKLWKSKLLSGAYTGGGSVALTPTPPAG